MFYLILIALLFINDTILTKFDHFFKKEIINNNVLVQKELIQAGFKKIYFTTSDSIKLCALFLDKSKKEKVNATIICCSGFYPGTKEGMAGIFSMLHDQPYNIMLLEARGHNESEGSFLHPATLAQYSMHEYKDIIAAINYCSDYNQKHNVKNDIIIYGLCAGAFHAIKAVAKHQTELDTVKGVVFDSGWTDLPDAALSTVDAEITNRCKSWHVSWLAQPLIWLVKKYYQLTLLDHHQKHPSINTILPTIRCPIFFIHCMQDIYVSILPIQQCCQKCQKASTWWIDHKIHANYYSHDPVIFKQKLIDFCSNCI